ncbi:MAG: FAD-binding oxidoreductase [Planctomycetota bacterium]
MVNRRQFLGAAAFAIGAGACKSSRSTGGGHPDGVVLNDVHSKLNATRVAQLRSVDSLAALRDALLMASRAGQSISIAGGRHAMGGQQFGTDTLHLDTRAMQRILDFDAQRGLLEVEAGIQWPGLMDFLQTAQAGRSRPWGIAQKQTGADRLSIGGALAANIHGRGLTLQPFVGDIESFVIVDATGSPLRCSREENRQLFELAIGGYGLFGAVYSVQLRLVPRVLLERVVEVRAVDGLAEAFEERIRDGFSYGDFQFETDERSPTFLTRGVFACYRPAARGAVIRPDQKELSREDWNELLFVAHADKARVFELYSQHYLASQGQIYWSDTQQLGYYPDDYHEVLDRRLGTSSAGPEMISELYVPRAELASFLHAAAAELRAQEANVIYGTIRLIERDDISVLAWARQPWAAVVLNLHVEHDAVGIERAVRAFRSLIDLARERGGSYYLTYHRWATRSQVEACHPRMVEFLRKKLALDPDQRFQSDWWRHYRAMFADVV